MTYRPVFLLLLSTGLFAPSRAFADSATNSVPSEAAPPTKSSAEPSDTAAEARTRYDRGVQLFEEGDYKLAAIEFERAYEIAPAFQVLYNIGQVNFQINNYAKALKAFNGYLRQGGDKVDPSRRAQVEALIKQLSARTAHVSIDTNVFGAQIMIDDSLAGTSPLTSYLVDAGQHRLVARKAGMLQAEQNITLAAGDNGQYRLELTEIPSNKPQTLAQEKPTYYWVGWTSAGVLAAGGIVAGVVALGHYNDYKDALNSNAASTDVDGTARRQQVLDARSATQTTSILAGALGGLALATAGVTLYFTLHDKKSAAVKVGVGADSVRFVGTF